MSYCRWINGSDIYMYGDIRYNGICCMWCCLEDKTHITGNVNEDGNVVLKTYSDAIKHMEEHQHAGHRAPYKRVINQLKEEQSEEGDIIDYSDIIENMNAESKRDCYVWNPLNGQFRWS